MNNGTARRLRNGATPPPGTTVLATVVCETCGARFGICHREPHHDQALALRQATWLADKFVWDHIQESPHRGSIELPAHAELTVSEKN